MAFTFLHTADWHLGKRLHGTELAEDHERFFEWLVATVKERQVKLVLISGDVFDLANPSSEARRQYYEVVLALHREGCQVVVTGGNHDSPMVLNAPKALLRALNVSVVGGMPEQPAEVLVPVVAADGDTVAVVAAIPYLRDADLRHGVDRQSAEDRVEAVRHGIARIFQAVAEEAAASYPGIPLVGMGHLFAHGAETSDSEREIQVGNLADFHARQFPEAYHYLALGHIHRPQQIGGTDRIQYSGSPIGLSFSERNDHKRVVLGTIAAGKVSVESLPIPEFRKLLRLRGPLAKLREGLTDLNPDPKALPTLIEMECVEDRRDPQTIYDLEELVANFAHPNARIVKYRVQFADQVSGANQLYTEGEHIQDLQPREVFERLLEREAPAESTRTKLLQAFEVVLEEVYAEMKDEA